MYLRCEVEHGVAVGQVVEVADEDEAVPPREAGARARLRLVRVGDDAHLDWLAPGRAYLRGRAARLRSAVETKVAAKGCGAAEECGAIQLRDVAHLRCEQRFLLARYDHRHRARRDGIELDVAQPRLLGGVGVLPQQRRAEDGREQRRVVAVSRDEGLVKGW